MADLSDVQRDLEILAADLKRLEAEYNMFFAGRLPRPPWETRNRVSAMVKRYDRGRIEGTGDRFRFEMLQSRFAALTDLWDRGLRAREEGRPGPFAQPPPKERSKKKALTASSSMPPRSRIPSTRWTSCTRCTIR